MCNRCNRTKNNQSNNPYFLCHAFAEKPIDLQKIDLGYGKGQFLDKKRSRRSQESWTMPTRLNLEHISDSVARLGYNKNLIRYYKTDQLKLKFDWACSKLFSLSF